MKMKEKKNFKTLVIFAIAATMCLATLALLPSASAGPALTVECDSTTGWTAFDATLSLDTTDYKEYSGSIKITSDGDAKTWGYYSGSWDFSTDDYTVFWFKDSGINTLNVLFIDDDNDESTFTFTTSTGWRTYVIDISAHPNTPTATYGDGNFDWTQVQQIYFGDWTVDTTFWIDYITIGDANEFYPLSGMNKYEWLVRNIDKNGGDGKFYYDVWGGQNTYDGALVHGINNANSGETVEVGKGIYARQLTIGKSITLQAAYAGSKPTIDVSGFTGYGIKVTVDNVVIDGFEIIGIPFGGSTSSNVNPTIRVEANNATVQNCVFNNATGTPAKEAMVAIPGTNNVSFLDNEVNNYLYGITARGSNWGGSATLPADGVVDLTVSGNTFNVAYNDTGLQIFGEAVQIHYGDNIVVTDNTINGPGTFETCTYGLINSIGIADFMSGYGAAGTIKYNNNDVTNCYVGIATFAGNGEISENTVDNNNIGIQVGQNDAVYISTPATGVAITGNDIESNTRGIWAQNFVLDGIGAHNNNIVGNTEYGILNGDPESDTFNATCNYWGSANGPTHSSNLFNVGAQGDNVSDNVDFCPWLDAASPGGTCSGPVENTDTGEYYSSIQAAINAASDCDTIEVSPGTYTESIYSVGKSLKLLAPSGATIKCPSSPHDVYVAESAKLVEYAVGLFGGTYTSGNDTVWGTDTITVEMSGFTIDADNHVPGVRWASIFCRNVNTDHCDNIASIHDNDLINCDVNGHETFGILCYGDMDITIQDNTIDQFARGGIGVNSGICEILGNTVIGPGLGVPVTWAPNGIQVGYGASGIIQGNEVSGCGWPGTAWAGTAILIVDTSNVLVDDNYVHDSETAIGVCDFPECLYGSTWAGVVSDITVTNNLIQDNEWGIDIVNDASNILVENNEIIDTIYDAIDVWAYDACCPAPSDIVINCNVIEGSGGDGLWVGPLVTETVDAECNWWGDCSGPYNATLNPDGLGDNVTGNADFDPWVGLITANAGGPYSVESWDTVAFDGTYTTPGCCGEAVSFEWDFGDGHKSTAEDPSHTYAAEDGPFTVTFTVTTETTIGSQTHSCSESDEVKVTISDDDPPIVQLEYPRGGEDLSGTIVIKWFALDSEDLGSPSIWLYYTADGGHSWVRIAKNLENTIGEGAHKDRGEYSWSAGSLPDGNYMVRIYAYDTAGNLAIDTSDPFAINNHNSGLLVSYVVVSSNYVKNDDSLEIKAGITQGTHLTAEEITADLSGLGKGTSVPADSFDGLTATWDLTNVACTPSDGPITITVTAGGESNTATITADNTLPELTVIKPKNALYFFNAKLFATNKPIIIGAITLEATADDSSGVQKTEIYIDNELKETFTGSSEWYMNLKLMGRHTLKIVAYDNAGNTKVHSQTVIIINPFGEK